MCFKKPGAQGLTCFFCYVWGLEKSRTYCSGPPSEEGRRPRCSVGPSLFSGEEGTCQHMFYFLKRQLLWKLEDADHKFDQRCLSFYHALPRSHGAKMSTVEGEGARVGRGPCARLAPRVGTSLQRQGLNLREVIKPPCPGSLCL